MQNLVFSTRDLSSSLTMFLIELLKMTCSRIQLPGVVFLCCCCLYLFYFIHVCK